MSNQPYCSLCGAKTINTCASCDSKIRGEYFSPRVLSMSSYRPPAYCGQCGAAFPWTEKRLSVAAELLEAEGISESDRALALDDLKELASETPKTDLAVYRTKKLIGKLGQGASQVFQKIVVEVAAEVVKKQFGM